MTTVNIFTHRIVAAFPFAGARGRGRRGHGQRLAVGQVGARQMQVVVVVVEVVIGGPAGRQLVLDVNVAVHVTDAVHVAQVVGGVHHLLVVLQTARRLGLQDHLFHGQGYTQSMDKYIKVKYRSWRYK